MMNMKPDMDDDDEDGNNEANATNTIESCDIIPDDIIELENEELNTCLELLDETMNETWSVCKSLHSFSQCMR